MIDPQILDEILEVLQERRVSAFSCPEFSVSMLPVAPKSMENIGEAIKEGNESLTKALPRGVFGHSSLWPDGAPSFPRADRERE